MIGFIFGLFFGGRKRRRRSRTVRAAKLGWKAGRMLGGR